MNLPNGKGIFIWEGGNCAKGDLTQTVAACQAAGLSWVALKIGDADNEWSRSYTDMAGAVNAFKAAGLRVWIWHYIYGGVWMDKAGNVVYTNGPTPEAEAAFALRNIQALQPDGYIIDAEKEFKAWHQAARAGRFMAALGHPVPIALADYRFPNLHPEFPFGNFLAGCDLHMPQMYWQPGGAVSEMDECAKELRGQRDIPIIPIGRCYIGDGNANPTPGEINAFLGEAKRLGCGGVSFWALDFVYLHPGGTQRMQAIQNFGWEGGTATVPPSPAPVANSSIFKTSMALWILTGPGNQYKASGSLGPGLLVQVVDIQNGYAMLKNGGWVAEKGLTPA